MIKNRVSPLQRAYRLGYLTGFKRGLNRARAEFWSETERWEGRLRELEDGYAEFVSKLRREQAVRDAVIERATIMRLN
jgi:hypothetical protein